MTAGEVTGKLSEGIARGIVDAQTAAHSEHAQLRHDERIAFMEHLERLLSDAFKELGVIDPADPTLTVEARAMLAPLEHPSHAVDFLFTAVAYIGVAFTGALAASAGINQQLTERALNKYADIKPAAQTTADMMVRGIIPDTLGNTWLTDVGTKSPASQAYVDAAFQQLPPGTIIELLRRGLIDQPTTRTLLKLNGLPPSAIEYMIELRHGPIDLGTAVAAVTQSQIDMPRFEDVLEWNGIDRSWANVIFQTAGQSPPPELAGRLFREGWIDEALYKKMLLESPLKNQYVDVLANLRFRFPPMRTVLKMLSDGLIDATTATTYLTKLGFFPVDADRLVASAAKHTTTAVKNLSPSTIEKLYGRRKYDRGTATVALETLGYDATEAGLLLDLVDDDKVHAAQAKAANAIGTRYVGWKIDRNAASQALDALAVAPTERDELLADWDEIRATRTAHLTRADIHKAVNATKMTPAEGIARLRAMGYDAADADLIPFIDKWTG